ncbi:magnesium transporter [Clohesyomyces aquaticus]|uniref:Magnesium transporter n=1 Tax=Clohesyomyces aquaticus TaxID=1231657 RepID=A0A1Y1ZFS9_9PLEO|nr:magnesium transporter [Clohesyomyces aquaticus]
MTLLSTTLNAVGLIFLTHAVYSTHEHTTTFPSAPLPLDITVELLFSTLVLSAGIVFASPSLKPIQWSRWAGKIEREGRQSEGTWTREGEEVLDEGDPYAFLGLDGGIGGKGEGRRGFWDVRGKRQEYAEWVKSGGKN